MNAISSCFWLLLLSLVTLSPQFSSAFSTHDDDEASKVQSMIAADIDAVLGRTFDYIIVGGGASGCPLAATLSQRYSVLLVERGGSPYGNPLIEDRENYGLPLLRSTPIAEEFFSEEGVSNSRGRVLGGSTAINGGFYSRASAGQVKRAGWDVGLVREAYEWVESKIVFPSPLTAWQFASAGGMVEGGIRPLNDFSLEHIQGTKVGAGIFDAHRRRHTSADLLAAGNTNNLTILLNATVQNIIFHDSGSGKPLRAHGIRFIKSDGNPNKFYEVHITEYPNVSGFSCGEVILSAGALGSPQILMLSGIGPKEHLTQFNITPIVDAGGVGQYMQDNPSIAIALDYSSHALHRMHPDPPQVAGISNDFRLIFETAVYFNTSIVPLVAGKIASPLSRGSLRLVSADPRQNPSVKFNYLIAEKDLDECVEMVRQIEKIAQSKSISAFVGRSRQSRLSEDEKELRNLCKEKVSTAYHYHGGCVVGSVVDKDYRVLGVRGLRVVDFSTFLDTPGTNPMATVSMLGRYQAVKMLREREMMENTSDEGVNLENRNLVTEY